MRGKGKLRVLPWQNFEEVLQDCILLLLVPQNQIWGVREATVDYCCLMLLHLVVLHLLLSFFGCYRCSQPCFCKDERLVCGFAGVPATFFLDLFKTMIELLHNMLPYMWRSFAYWYKKSCKKTYNILLEISFKLIIICNVWLGWRSSLCTPARNCERQRCRFSRIYQTKVYRIPPRLSWVQLLRVQVPHEVCFL